MPLIPRQSIIRCTLNTVHLAPFCILLALLQLVSAEPQDNNDPGRVIFSPDIYDLPLAPLVYPVNVLNKDLDKRLPKPYDRCERFMPPHIQNTFIEQGSCFRKILYIGDSAKCGSTFLYESLVEHPLFVTASKKELCAFRNWGNKKNWTGFWSEYGPTPRNCHLNPAKPFAFDGCPNDQGWSFPEWKSCLYQDAFLILLVRDPIEKIVSGFHYWRKYEPHLGIDDYIKNKTFLVRASDYMAILQAHLAYWPAHRILIVDSVGIKKETCDESMRNVTDFLGIPPIEHACTKSGEYLNKGHYQNGHFVPSLQVQHQFWDRLKPGMEAFFRMVGYRYDFGAFQLNSTEITQPNHVTTPTDESNDETMQRPALQERRRRSHAQKRSIKKERQFPAVDDFQSMPHDYSPVSSGPNRIRPPDFRHDQN
eukprot:gb/GEZN01004007.1/.p1 GENE.gb/GEZN01004007.1/~~gb/GEZN01004007.1/.p1  ORF type:complete len:422 (-),score=46.60 gb/GEZN01004007.1/:662-1927(-)